MRKTIAVDSDVYEKLVRAKREGESFSTLIDRLVGDDRGDHTGHRILLGLAELPALAAEDAEIMLAVVAEDRDTEAWEGHDLG